MKFRGTLNKALFQNRWFVVPLENDPQKIFLMLFTKLQKLDVVSYLLPICGLLDLSVVMFVKRPRSFRLQCIYRDVSTNQKSTRQQSDSCHVGPNFLGALVTVLQFTERQVRAWSFLSFFFCTFVTLTFQTTIGF